MKAEIKNHRSEKRTQLHNVIPLNTPFRIHIETSNICNFKCIFCAPYNSVNANIPKGNMAFDLFKKVIDDLKCFPEKVKKLYFHSFGEPLINKELPEMIEYAKKQNVAETLELITNGSLLNPELNRKLVKAGLDHIGISLEGINEKQYLDIAKYKIDFEKYINNIKDFYKNKGNCTVYIKIADIAINSEEDKKYFYEKFGNICDSIFIENIVNQDESYNYDELKKLKTDFNEGQYGEKLQELVACPNIFFMMVVNSNGTVSPCCVDWKRQLIIGNAKNESLVDIWNGENLRKLQLLHLKRERYKHSICSKCNFLKYSTDSRDSIDDYLLSIIGRISK